MDDRIAVVPIMFPGRGPRIDEDSYDDFTSLINDATREISTIKMPLYFYGGCFGGLCGYEIIRRLRDDYQINAEGFFINSLYAPADIDTSEGISELDEEKFIEAIWRKGELPSEVIQDDRVMSFLLGGIRDDYILYESYKLEEDSSKIIDSPIKIFVKDESELKNSNYTNWSEYSSKEIQFDVVNCGNLFDSSAQVEIAKRINCMINGNDVERI